MAGNSQRRGAVSKKNKTPKVGSGGWGRQSLEGRGPTPKAEERTYHKAYRAKQLAERAAAKPGNGRGQGRPASNKQRRAGASAVEVVAGRNAVVEALRAGVPVSTLYVSSRIDMDDRVRDSLQMASERGLNLMEVGKPELDRLTDGAIHQGLAAQVPPYEYGDPEDLLDAAALTDRPPLVVALDGVTDPRNLGAVLRSAGAFGAHGVLVPQRRAAGVTVSAWKVSAGAAARVPVARATNLVRALQDYKAAGCFVVGLDAGGDTDIEQLPFSNDPLVVVVGSEGKGLSRLVRETCDAIASISIGSSVESLNAAVATGIALHEIARQRRSGE